MQTDNSEQWQFWIDRGGTFTDIVASDPQGQIVTHKLLSDNPEQYEDAAIQGIRDILNSNRDNLGSDLISAVKMGTTVATNALLERTGTPCVLITTKGFRDALRIGYQTRPDLFSRQIKLPHLLYDRVIEIDQRYSAAGEVLKEVDCDAAYKQLKSVFDEGIRSCAIVFLHGYRFHGHENLIAEMARQIGYSQVSTSHEVSPLMKMIGRGDTTVVDAYLSPVLRRYVDQVASHLSGVRLMFMQSNGGLTDAYRFQGKDSILSGPAGGIVGAVETSKTAGFDKIIAFDMGGTSTDVSHYAGEYERAYDTHVAGVRIRSPIMRIHTVAAGGGSILKFDGLKYRVGPESAGANPGPACYRRDGPLTITDCNLILGKLQPDYFPKIFGPTGDQPLDTDAVIRKFEEMAETIRQSTGDDRSAHGVAEGFLNIAIDNMANAIKKISVQRGYDITEYTLCSFGGAGGQHACLVADALGVETVFIHPYAGVLSAYGIGLADVRTMYEEAVEDVLSPALIQTLDDHFSQLADKSRQDVRDQHIDDSNIDIKKRIHVRYEGTDSAVSVDADNDDSIRSEFESKHRQRFGFIMPEKPIVVEAISVEAIGRSDVHEEAGLKKVSRQSELEPTSTSQMYLSGEFRETKVYLREALQCGDEINGPAVIVEPTGTTVVEIDWKLEVTECNHLILKRTAPRPRKSVVGTDADPVMLEVFNNLFMSIAEQMGASLENSAYSVNIKERLDFSCAIFDTQGDLVANAPHMPVHLGSMGESVKIIIRNRIETMKPGDAFVLNNPYNGGTHLPDITVVTPVFEQTKGTILFYVASRGHHADVGGITPGSMPPDSHVIEEEGVLLDDVQLMREGVLLESDLRTILEGAQYPVRNVEQNLADIRAQIAANEKGVQELRNMVEHFGLDVVVAYMQHVQDNAEGAVKRVLKVLRNGRFKYEMDDASVIAVEISIDNENQTAVVDFTGTSAQLSNNFNAPSSVARAAVMYVFRTLVDDVIPMNEGCLKPIKIVIPDGCMLKPVYPAAVVAGNVETSQYITDALYGALGVMAAAQGTMNNFTFGNDTHQYYETICGGSGAGPDFDGCDAVHTHMTNAKLTDPEVLEWRFPIRLESFSIRQGSGGKGRHRGGNGAIRKLRFLETMTAAILSGHRRIPPYGADGGGPGQTGKNYVIRASGEIESMNSTDRTEMNVNDIFVIETPGGGGFGSPN
ncbi:MAG: hydantoinase B/oxoprolinase family protein [Acidiferrobacterales bacterium]|nr:hydantoinase B/oxoprolinase family protein [Acidiferrobacterales bacterium]